LIYLYERERGKNREREEREEWRERRGIINVL
jgi:hypothetical protein